VEQFIEVTKEEYYAVIRSYPNTLNWDVYFVCEPPMGTHNDFSKGLWPESIVGKINLNDNQEHYGFKDSQYFILNSLKSKKINGK